MLAQKPRKNKKPISDKSKQIRELRDFAPQRLL